MTASTPADMGADAMTQAPCWSADDETFTDDFQQALDEANEWSDTGLKAGDTIYQADIVQRKAGHYFSKYLLKSLCEQMAEAAYEEVGEVIPDDWPVIDLDKLRAWLDENVPVPFYGIANVRPYVVTQEDVDMLGGKP